MRLFTIATIIVSTLSLSMGQFSFAEDLVDSQAIGELVQGYTIKAVRCEQLGDSSCSAACVEAIKLVRDGPSAELEIADKVCDSGFVAIQAQIKKQLAEPLLRDDYAWMPDVEATVIRARGAPFLVEGRSDDWVKYCSDGVRFGGAANDEASRKLIRTPGKKVILKHVQYPMRRTVTLDCVVGDIEERL